MEREPGKNLEKSFDPEKRIAFFLPTEKVAAIQSGNRLAYMASADLHLIRLLAEESSDKQGKTDLLRKAIHVDPAFGEYVSLEYNAWKLHAMTEDEQEIALSSVDDKTKEVLLRTMDEVVVREKAYQERIEMATKEAQPKIDELTEQLREEIIYVEEQKTNNSAENKLKRIARKIFRRNR